MSARYYIYVLLCKDHTYYTGVSPDPIRRERDHNTPRRGARYTRSRRPVRLVWTQLIGTKSEALKAEISFKKLGREEKQRVVEGKPSTWELQLPPSVASSNSGSRQICPSKTVQVLEVVHRSKFSAKWSFYALQSEGSVEKAVAWLLDRDKAKFLDIIGHEDNDAYRLTDLCVVWPLALNKDGFGDFRTFKGKAKRAHRMAFELFCGVIPKDYIVYHTCGNTGCVTPGHLRVGTYKQALALRVQTRRNATGEGHGRAKLCWEDVDEIRDCHAKGMLISDLALAFDVNPTTISNVVRRKTWVRK